MEKWKNIQGFENYMISNYGNLKTLNFNHTNQERQIKIFKNARGYMSCNLVNGTKRKRFLVHRLVGIYFIENEFELKTINHIDNNKENNHYSNLEWMSAEDNLKLAHKQGLIKYSKGETHYQSKLSTESILKIRALLSKGIKGREIAKMFNVHEKYISSIKTKKSRKYETN